VQDELARLEKMEADLRAKRVDKNGKGGDDSSSEPEGSDYEDCKGCAEM